MYIANYNIKYKIYILLIFSILFLPSIFGTRYYPALFIYIASLFLMLRNAGRISKKFKILILLALFEFIEAYISILIGGGNYNLKDLFFYSLQIFIPLLAYYSGLKLIKNNYNTEYIIKNIILIIIIAQSITGIFQIISPQFRMLTLQLYSSMEKYTRTFSGGLVRAVGTIGNPNNYGCLISIFACLYLYLSLSNIKHNIKNISFLVTIITIATLAIIYSQSSTAIIIYILLSLYVLINKKYLKYLLIFILIFLIFLIFMVNYNRNIISIFISYFSLKDILAMHGRTDLWAKYFDIFKSELWMNKLFGNGEFLYSGTFDNAYLKIIVSNGLIGLILYFLKMIIIISYPLKKNISKAQNIIIFGIILLNITSELDLITQVIYFSVIGSLESLKNNKNMKY